MTDEVGIVCATQGNQARMFNMIKKEPLKFPEQRGWGAVSAPAKALIAAMLVKKPEVTKPPRSTCRLLG